MTWFLKGVIIPPNNIETQDLIIISDVVLTDYSSIIFDALTVDKKVAYIHPITLNMSKNVVSIKT